MKIDFVLRDLYCFLQVTQLYNDCTSSAYQSNLRNDSFSRGISYSSLKSQSLITWNYTSFLFKFTSSYYDGIIIVGQTKLKSDDSSRIICCNHIIWWHFALKNLCYLKMITSLVSVKLVPSPTGCLGLSLSKFTTKETWRHIVILF